MKSLERHQVQHAVNRLLLGDDPLTFRYHGVAFTVARAVNGYTVSTRTEERFLHSRSLHKNMTEAVMTALDDMAHVRRCVTCNAILTPANWKVSRKAGLKVYLRSFCKDCYKPRDVSASLKWRASNRKHVTDRQRERRQEKRSA